MSFKQIVNFETGYNYEADSSGMTLDSSSKIHGTYSARCNATTTATAFFQVEGIGADGYKTNYNEATLVARCYLRIATLPSADSEEILSFYDTAGALKMAVRVTSAGKLQVYQSDGTTQIGSDGSTTLSLNTNYCIEAKCGTGAGAAYGVRIDGVSELSGTSSNLGNNNHGPYVRFGKATNRNGRTVDFYYDTVAIDNANYPGLGSSAILYADSDGTYTTWTASTGNRWDCVNEIPPNTSSEDYVLSTLTSGNKVTFGLISCSTASISGTINAVKVVGVSKRNASANGTYRLALRSNTTDVGTTTNRASTSTYAVVPLISYLAVTDPATSSAWTTSGLDAVEIGLEERETTDRTRCTGIYLIVDFSPSTDATVNAVTMTATAVGVAPGVSASSSVAGATATVTAEMIAPSVSTVTPVVVSAVPMTATGADLAEPGVSASSSVTAVVMTATAAGVAPAVSASSSVAAVTMTATGEMAAPSVTGVSPVSATVTAVAMTAVAAMIVPRVGEVLAGRFAMVGERGLEVSALDRALCVEMGARLLVGSVGERPVSAEVGERGLVVNV